MAHIRTQFRKRGKHKSAVLHVNMRNHQILTVIYDFIVKNNIKIQCPRSPVLLSSSVCMRLNFMQQRKKLLRLIKRLQFHAAVQKILLLDRSVWSGLYQTGGTHLPHTVILCQFPDSVLNQALAVTHIRADS